MQEEILQAVVLNSQHQAAVEQVQQVQLIQLTTLVELEEQVLLFQILL
tara:strand:+ start:184 stop:327 length:144 start_codon:yes stop_codon:yes gene_type:complete